MNLFPQFAASFIIFKILKLLSQVILFFIFIFVLLALHNAMEDVSCYVFDFDTTCDTYILFFKNIASSFIST